jgi:ParB/RepB/Spo0J family partition protein
MAEVETLNIPVSALDESYGRFRLVHPASEAKVLESLRAFGQILPVVTVKGLEPHRYVLIDGFKRLRACRELGLKSIQMRVLSVGERPAKAAILELNWKAGSIRKLEEALILQSLHREDKLSQVDIALLVRRHKSWVCRRIALVERLSGEVLDHLKLGLIVAGQGRQLTRLPRDNQAKALETIVKHRLCCRETERLVTLLLERPRWEHDSLLHLPLEILDDRSAPRPLKARTESGEASLAREIHRLGQWCKRLYMSLDAADLSPFSPEEQEILRTSSERVEALLRRLRHRSAPVPQIPTP